MSSCLKKIILIMIYRNRKFIHIKNKTTILLITLWTLLLLTINTNYNDVLRFNDLILNLNFNLNSFLIIINYLRFLFPFFLIILLLLIIKKLKLKNNFNHLTIIFFIYGIWQIIAYILTTENLFALSIYQIFFSFISLIIIFHITEQIKILRIYELFYNIFLGFISIIVIIFGFNLISSSILANNFSYFYGVELLSPSSTFLMQAIPRVTGLGRLSIIIFIFCFFYLIKKKHKNTIKYFLFLSLFILSTFIYILQSRGAYIGLVLTILVYFLFHHDKLTKKIFIFIFIWVLPILTFESLKYTIHLTNNFKNIENAKNIKNENENENENEFFLKNNRYIYNQTSSGRVEIWSNSLNIIKDEKIIIGRGPQSDRKLIDEYLRENKNLRRLDVLENNSSNALIYSYLCGGIIGFILLINIYYAFTKEITKSIFVKKVINSNDAYASSSLTILIYLIIRSLFENSFALFSIDLFLALLSYFILINFKKKQ